MSRALTPRFLAVDVARAVAIVGMIAVNVGPRTDTGAAALVIRVAHGRASVLFVLLAGLGVGLLARRSLGAPALRPCLTLLWRAAVLLVLGLGLQMLDHGVQVILPTYAALFLLAPLLLRLQPRLLLIAAFGVTAIGPLAWIAVRQVLPYAGAVTLTDPPQQMLLSVLLTGPYPVVTWLAPFLLGLWLSHLDLADWTVRYRLLGFGLIATGAGSVLSRVLALALGQPGADPGFDRLVSAVGHSQMPLWLLSGMGSAAAVLGAALFLPGLERSPGRWWVRAPVALGQVSLTVYAAHLIFLAAFVRPGPESAAAGLALTAILTASGLAFAVCWRSRFARGPLEIVLRLPRRRSRPPKPASTALETTP